MGLRLLFFQWDCVPFCTLFNIPSHCGVIERCHLSLQCLQPALLSVTCCMCVLCVHCTGVLTFCHSAWVRVNPTTRPWSHFHHRALDDSREAKTRRRYSETWQQYWAQRAHINRCWSLLIGATSSWSLVSISDFQLFRGGFVLFRVHLACLGCTALRFRCKLGDIWFQRLPDGLFVPSSAPLGSMGIQCTSPPFLYSSRLSAIRKKKKHSPFSPKRGVLSLFKAALAV